MNSLKKISLCFMFVIAIFCCTFSILQNKEKVLADSEDIVLSVQKVDYTNSAITNPDASIKKLGEYTSAEIYSNLQDILNTTKYTIDNTKGVSINTETNEAVLVTLLSNSEKNYIITYLDVALVVNGTEISFEPYNLNSSGTNYAYFKAFDFSTLKTRLEQDYNYKELGYGNFNYRFTCSYKTSGQDTITITKDFNFFMVENSSYFGSNLPHIDNTEVTSINDETTYYFNNNKDGKNPILSYNPTKYKPTITIRYNESTTILTPSLMTEKNGKNYVELISDNQNVYENKLIEVTSSTLEDGKINYIVKLTFDTLGEYEIKYNLVINNEVIEETRTSNIENFPSYKLYIFGFEAFYKDYSNADALSYKKLYNETYKSNFSFLYSEKTSFDEVKDAIDLSGLPIAKTNQAPVKINNYTTTINDAKYYKVTGNTLSSAEAVNYTPSKRFDTLGTYVVIIEYEFSLISSGNFYDVIIFTIENNTPTITFESGDNNSWTIMTGNTFTNKNVKVSWDNQSLNPFSVNPNIKIVKNDTVLDIENTVKEESNKKYVIFSENGTYLVEITYGINHSTKVEKSFTIDNTEFEFKLFDIDKNNDEFSLGNELIKEENYSYYATENDFSLFVKNKQYNNKVSIKYDYISLETISLSGENWYEITDNELYIFNQKELNTLYTNLTYYNNTLNNLENWSDTYIVDNTNAVITNAGLYHFIISDNASNTKDIFVFLDTSSPVVLQVEDILEENETTENFLNTNKDNLKIKETGRNFVSNNYSLIFGNYKAIKFNINAENLEFAKVFYDNSELTVGDNAIIPSKYSSITIENNETSELSYIKNTQNNIVCVTAPSDEVDIVYNIKSQINEKEYSYTFNLNTDKNKILIYGYDDKYFRIYKEDGTNVGVTNSSSVYIRYNDDYIDGFKLDSLQLDFYPFDFGNDFSISTTPLSYDILKMSKTSTVVENINNSILSGGFISDMINPTVENGQHVTREGKYVLTKTYKGYDSSKSQEENGVYKQVSQTFYVDRHSPIEKVNEYVIGQNYNMKLDGNNLTSENVMFFLLNNQNILTNMTKLSSDIKDILKYNTLIKNLKVNYRIFNNKDQKIFDSKTDGRNYSFKETGIYLVEVYDNAGYFYDGIENINENYISFKIEINNNAPTGNYIIDGNKIVATKSSSTKSGNLAFYFEDSESDYLYDIDLTNLTLVDKKTNTIIFKTYSSNTTESNYSIVINGKTIYYYSLIGKVNFEVTKLSSNKLPSDRERYSYTITILDEKNKNILFDENGNSKEAEYVFTLSYQIDGNPSYKSSEFTMVIDHTNPYKNANSLIDKDFLLTSEEKQLMKNSVENKDRTPILNFENYAFVIKSIEDIPMFFEKTDTNLIYIRKYDKYSSLNAEDLQSLVLGDLEYNSSSRLKFSVNAVDASGNKIYSTKSYNEINADGSYRYSSPADFFQESGYYEIIEIDEAENYTIYSILYLPELNYDFTVSYNDGSAVTQMSTDFVEINSNSFTLSNINLKSPYLPLNIELKINEITENLRYFPVSISSDNITYFNSIESLLNHINLRLSEEGYKDQYGASYVITISNQTGSQKVISINTPGEKLELTITDFEDKFVITVPNKISGTSIKTLEIYPIIGGIKETTPLKYDSEKREINLADTLSFTFNSKVYLGDIDNLEEKTGVSIFYIEWTDNFDRKQSIVKVLGVEDIRKLDLENIIYSDLDGDIFTASTNLDLIYQSNLYNLKVEYTEYPSTTLTVLFDTSIKLLPDNKTNEYHNWNSTGKRTVNLFEELRKSIEKQMGSEEIKTTDIEERAYKFYITLTDLASLDGDTPKTYDLSYIYYPYLPSIVFTDSASNVLDIKPYNLKDTFELSTSRNVTLSYINNTKFAISISAIREYEENNIKITEKISNISNGHIFNGLGSYEINVKNILGKEQTYKFNIKPSSNKTYAIYTDEIGMTNFELSDFIVEVINENNFEVYYTIFKTKIEVNSDFNLILEEIESENTNEKLYVIKQYHSSGEEHYVPYKYIAIKKVNANNNFLRYDSKSDEENEKPLLQIYNQNNVVINNEIKTSTLKTTDTIKVTTPLYNEGNNKITMKLYYNNKEITFNSNFYKIDTEGEGYATQTIDFKILPSGIYNLYFEDLAGNTQTFAGNLFLNILYMKEVIVKLNDENPINYQIYNGDVLLKLEQENQYDSRSIKITAKRNGKEIDDIGNKTQYTFTEYGFYEVSVSGAVSGNSVSKKITFTILNPNEAMIEYGIVPLNNQTITKIIKDDKDITNDIKKFIKNAVSNEDSSLFKDVVLDKLSLSHTLYFYEYEYELDEENNIKLDENGNKIVKKDENGNEIFKTYTFNASGHYEIFIENQNAIIGAQSFSFKVWIREENINLRLKSSVEEGKTTTKAITFSYNPYLIFSQIGDSKIYLNDKVIMEINEQSENNVFTYEIPRSSSGTYILQVKTDSGNTELSFVINKKEPLSTVSIIVIVLVSVIVAVGIFLFIKLRTRMKVK